MNKKSLTGAVVLFSGGQDSTTCLAAAMANVEGPIYALGFDYGQRHKVELDQAKVIAQKENIPFEILNLQHLANLTHSALTNSAIKIETPSEKQLPNTFVPGRNMLFLLYAAIYADSKGINTLYTGVCETDYSGYPDCRQNFISSMENTVSLALDKQFTIVTPLMFLSKAETVQLMSFYGKLDLYRYSHTCYEGMRPACGKCPACVLRLKGFHNAGINDPLEYCS
tara:strand:+ start:34 stop:708 length:675 start_codon:yes stop_codon:yes gene_type:complete